MSQLDLENRLIDFAVLIINVIEDIPNSKSGNHLSGQLIRSGTSPALNYGEARGAESRKDFIHKIQVVLKELRETYIALKIIHKSKLCENNKLIKTGIKENDELISIFVKSTQTAKKNMP